jgi:hypothetical protein
MMPNELETYREGPNTFEFKGTNEFMLTFDMTSKDVSTNSWTTILSNLWAGSRSFSTTLRRFLILDVGTQVRVPVRNLKVTLGQGFCQRRASILETAVAAR